jgi:hypothetical protein
MFVFFSLLTYTFTRPLYGLTSLVPEDSWENCDRITLLECEADLYFHVPKQLRAVAFRHSA